MGQELNQNYMLFSKTGSRTNYLNFKNDSIVSLKPYYSNIGCSLSNRYGNNTESEIYKDYSYSKQNDTLKIYDFQNSKSFDFKITNERFFENADLGMVYVLRNFYDEFPDIAVKFENEIYWLDSPETSNGIVRKGGKNSKLARIFNGIVGKGGKKNRKLARNLSKKDTTNINIQVHKGYQAFERFGFEYVFGIIEVSEK